jgi:hypothetical protein
MKLFTILILTNLFSLKALSSSGSSLWETCSRDEESLESSIRELEATITIQAVCRGFKARKNLKNILDNNNELNEKFSFLLDDEKAITDTSERRQGFSTVVKEIITIIKSNPLILDITTINGQDVLPWRNTIERKIERLKVESPVSLDGIFGIDDFDIVDVDLDEHLVRHLERIKRETFF